MRKSGAFCLTFSVWNVKISRASWHDPCNLLNKNLQREDEMSGISRTTTNHNTIQRWTEARGGRAARVEGTARHSAGLLRIHFPEGSDDDTLVPIEWDDFFEKFEEKELALVYQEATSDGEISRFNKIVSRGNVDHPIEN